MPASLRDIVKDIHRDRSRVVLNNLFPSITEGWQNAFSVQAVLKAERPWLRTVASEHVVRRAADLFLPVTPFTGARLWLVHDARFLSLSLFHQKFFRNHNRGVSGVYFADRETPRSCAFPTLRWCPAAIKLRFSCFSRNTLPGHQCTFGCYWVTALREIWIKLTSVWSFVVLHLFFQRLQKI